MTAGWVGELAVPIYRGRDVTGFAQDDTGVTSSSPTASRCGRNISSGDGGRSLIRNSAGIEFSGWNPTRAG
jgi:3-(3-hydroxy-phenyl)propionate hydroxylase